MTEQEQQIAIAEWCGWKMYGCGWWTDPKNPGRANTECPDYLHDLNAMHEAEEKLGELLVEWAGYLYQEARSNHYDKDVAMAKATAAQRAEALLKTIGKWKE